MLVWMMEVKRKRDGIGDSVDNKIKEKEADVYSSFSEGKKNLQTRASQLQRCRRTEQSKC